MNISLPISDPMNTIVKDDKTHGSLYQMTSPVMRLFRGESLLHDAQGKIIAEFVQRVGHNKLTYRGETKNASDFVKRASTTADARIFTAVDGHVYKWKRNFSLTGGSIVLIDGEGHTVAHSVGEGLDNRAILRLELEPVVLDILDDVVLSLLLALNSWKGEHEACLAAASGA